MTFMIYSASTAFDASTLPEFQESSNSKLRFDSLNRMKSQQAEPDPSSLAIAWAQKYVNSVTSFGPDPSQPQLENFTDLVSDAGRSQTAQKLGKHLTLASALAWSLTESLLSDQISRHQIDPDLINPWQIAADSHDLFQVTLAAYAEGVTPQRLSVLVSSEFGRIRRKYTEIDPRVIGFVSMQFHYTGRKLQERLSLAERALLAPYLKVMDDHLYMPLREAYEAAANHEPQSPALAAVQRLLPISTAIAHSVSDQVRRQHPAYQSFSGPLASAVVRTSSIRDVEMFQVYLCLCVLEGSIQVVQGELFPLCVMLYPTLNVSWKLVQDMLQTLAWEMHDRLTPHEMAVFLPYLQTLIDLFSPQVFQES